MTDTTQVTMAQVADKTVDKVSNFVEIAAAKATNVFDAAANISTEAVKTYGANVLDAVLWVVRIDAIQTLVTSWMFLFCVSWW